MKKINVCVLLTFLFLCFPTKGKAQKVEEILNKVTKFYKDAEEYKVQIKFSMLRGLNGKEVTESYTATMEKNGGYVKNVILGTTVLVFPGGQIIKDDDNRKITYSKETNFSNLSATFNMADFLKHYGKSQLLDMGGHWVCEMVSAPNNFSKLPYSKVELHIDKKNYNVTKQILYFSKLIPFRDKADNSIQQDYGRMIIELQHDFESKVARQSLEDFVTVHPNKGVQLQKEYNNYQLINNTPHN